VTASDYQEAIAAEESAIAAIKDFARANSAGLRLVWGWGDGDGGGVLEIIAKEIGVVRAWERPRRPKGYTKAVISSALRTEVFERDAYRCVACGGYKDLSCDHIHPESKGGPTTMDNLQTMCRPCNSKKGVRA